MTAIADEHGGTIDKFIGDAMLIVFGDPEAKADRADAQACLRMAILQSWRTDQGYARIFGTIQLDAWRSRMKPKTTNREVRRMIRQQSAWITLNGEATTERRTMDISKRGAKIAPDGSSVVPARLAGLNH